MTGGRRIGWGALVVSAALGLGAPGEAAAEGVILAQRLVYSVDPLSPQAQAAVTSVIVPAGAGGAAVRYAPLSDLDAIAPLTAELLRQRRLTLPGDACPADPPEFTEAADRARRALSFFKLDEAGAAFMDARISLRCGADVPTPAALGEVMMTGALLQAFQGEAPEERFAAALAADRGARLEAGMPAEVVAAFQRAQGEADRAAMVVVNAPPERLGGLTLVVDGRALAGPAQVARGLHLVQLASPQGIAAGGEWVQVGEGGAVDVVPASLAPQSPKGLGETLRQGVAQGRLPPEVEAAAEAARRAQGVESLAILTVDPSTPTMVRGVLLTDAGPERLSVRVEGGSSRGSPLERAALPTLAGASVLGGVVYGAAFVGLSRWPVESYAGDPQGYEDDASQARRIRALGYTGGALCLASALGAGAVVAKRTIHPREGTTVTVGLALGPQVGGMSIAGGLQW